MIKKYSVTILTFLFSISLSYAQQQRNVSDQMTGLSSGGQNTFSLINFAPLPPKGLKGDYYYVDEWRTGSFKLTNDNVYEDVLIKYYTDNDLIVFDQKGEKKTVNGRNVSSFTWTNPESGEREFFVNAKNYKLDGVPFTRGFLRVWNEGEIKMLSKREFWIKEADYDARLGAGKRFDEIKFNDDFYIGKNGEIVLVENSRKKTIKKVRKLLGMSNIETYVKAEKIKFKNPEDIEKFVQFLNSKN